MNGIDTTCLAIAILVIVVLLMIARQTNKWEVLGVIIAAISIWMTVKTVFGVDIFMLAVDYISRAVSEDVAAGGGFKEVMLYG